MNWVTKFVMLGLVVSITATCVGIVYSKHTSRKLFVELQDLEFVRDKINVEWGQLQLEQSTWATHGRIEEIARNKLKMMIPKTETVVILR